MSMYKQLKDDPLWKITPTHYHSHCWCRTVFIHDGIKDNIRHKECCVCGDRKVVIKMTDKDSDEKAKRMREHRKRYRDKFPEKVKETNRKWIENGGREKRKVARQKRMLRDPEARRKQQESCRKTKQKHPERDRARQLLSRAIIAGKLKRGSCLVCGAKDAHGHHENYDKPLDVMWLCYAHHAKRHTMSLDDFIAFLRAEERERCARVAEMTVDDITVQVINGKVEMRNTKDFIQEKIAMAIREGSDDA